MAQAKRKPARQQKKSVFRRILVPLDGTPLGEAALPYVEELASITGAEVILLQVVKPDYDIAIVGPYSSPLDKISREYITHASAAAVKYLKSIEERLAGEGIAAEAMVQVGSPAEQVMACAREKNIDLIALSSHGHPGVGQRLLGSVTYKILHYADRPVFIVTPSTKSTTRG
jgi:nucleotide-binding universal stress UspA family protein